MLYDKDKPLISIALCVYNGERFLAEQLDSIVTQSYKNIEIIAVDDCSADSSWEILNEYQCKYSCFRIYQNDFNLGHTKNFEKALRLCNGEFIALSDQDDVWHPDKLKLQLANIKDHQLIYHDSTFMNDNGVLMRKKMSDIINLYSGDNPEAFLFLNCVSGHTCFFHRTLIDYVLPFHPDHFHDHWIAYVATNLGTISYIPQCLVNYRQHMESSTDILNRRKEADKNYHENRDIIKLRRDLKWIEHCASFPHNRNQQFVRNLSQLLRIRLDSYLSIQYAKMIRDHFEILYFIQKTRKSKKNAFIYRQIWGLKAKLLWARILENPSVNSL